MYSKASTPPPSNSFLKRFSPSDRHNPVESPCWTPLEQAVVRVSPRYIWKPTSAGRVPKHGHKQGDRWHAIGHLRKYHRAFDTKLSRLGQSVITSQLVVSCSVRACNATYSTPPGKAAPNCLTSLLTCSNRGYHCRIAPAVINLLIFRHFSSSAESRVDQFPDVR